MRSLLYYKSRIITIVLCFSSFIARSQTPVASVPLEITTTSTSVSGLRLMYSGARLGLRVDGTWNYYEAWGSQGHAFSTGGLAGRLVVHNNGNVGIGLGTIAAPTAPLHVYGSVNGEVDLLVENAYSGQTRTFVSSFPNKSSIQTDKDFTIMTNGGGWSDKLILTNAGNLGIGLTNPSTRVEIRNGVLRLSDIDIRGLQISQDASGTPNGMPANSYSGARQFKLTGWAAATAGGSIEKDIIHFDGFNLLFQKDAEGKVGIGTSKPDERLTVKGNIHAEGVKVDLNVPAPDYVFAYDYKLPSLMATKAFINQHKHLPEVPAALDFEQDGIDLGEMNMILLKKIEELTLHLIEQAEINRQQNDRIVKLETELTTKKIDK